MTRIAILLVSALLPGCLATPEAGVRLNVSPQEAGADSSTEDDVATPEEDVPDPADPTRIETRGGGGYQYTNFTNNADLHQLRGKFGLTIAGTGVFVVDLGIGATFDARDEDDEFGLTDGRFRYFHLVDIDRSRLGWQGWGASIELQTQGSVPGTDGSNSLSIGTLGAFGLAKGLAIYLNPQLAHVSARDLDESLGAQARADAILIYKPGRFWRGAFLKLRPSYSYGLSEELEDEGTFLLETRVGGAMNDAKNLWWEVELRTFFEKDLERVSTGSETGLQSDWSVFLNFVRFF